MVRKIVTYGIAAGLIVGIPLSLMVVLSNGRPPAYGMAIGYTMMLVAFSLVFVAIKRHRDHELGGVIHFWPAFGLGLGISAVAGILYVVSWETATAMSGLDFAAEYGRMIVEQERASGASEAQVARVAADMDSFRASYADPLYRLPITFSEIFPVGLLVSLLSAALLRNPRFLPARA